MRLIDADELHRSIRIQMNSCDEDYGRALLNIALKVSNAEGVKAIPIEQLLSILPKYDDYIHMKTYPHNETMEDIYSKGHEAGWNACLKAIKEELEEWEKENETN